MLNLNTSHPFVTFELATFINMQFPFLVRILQKQKGGKQNDDGDEEEKKEKETKRKKRRRIKTSRSSSRKKSKGKKRKQAKADEEDKRNRFGAADNFRASGSSTSAFSSVAVVSTGFGAGSVSIIEGLALHGV